MLGRVVLNVLGSVDRGVLIGARRRVVRVDGLARHRQGAEALGHLVVGLLGGAVPVDGVGVGAAARLGLGAGGPEGCRLAGDEAGDRALVGERRAIVGLGGARGGDLHGCRGHDDGAGVDGDVELVGDVLTLGVADDELVRRGGHAGGDVGRGGGRGGLGDDVALGQRAHRDGGAVGLAVVDEGAAAHVDDDLLGGLGNDQVANGRAGERVVGLLGGAGPLKAVDVLARADLALGARDLEVDRLAVDEAVDAAVGGEDAAVVDLGRGVGGDGVRRWRDLIGTRHRSGVVGLAGDGHGDGAGDVGEVVGSVGHVVVGALDELAAGLVGDGRDPLVLVAVVDDIARAVDPDAVIGARRRVVRVDQRRGRLRVRGLCA